MATTNVSRFYLTDLRVKISQAETSSSGRYEERRERIDPIPPPSIPPAPAPVKVCPPMPRPAPACPPMPRPAPACPPAPRCPPAPACPPVPVKIPISGIIDSAAKGVVGYGGKHIIVRVKVPNNIQTVPSVGALQSIYPDAILRITEGGGKHKTKKFKSKRVKTMKGGQASLQRVNPSTYLFRPSTFNFNESNNSVFLPVYFDYYAYLTKNFSFIGQGGNPLSSTGPGKSSTGSETGLRVNNIIMGIDRLLSCSFILDKNNIPYYITRIKEGTTETYYGVVKKTDPNNNYSDTNLTTGKFFKLDTYISNTVLVVRTKNS